ncbi:MAG: amino acid permease-associated region [Massilibacillus sp.]|jgi:L-asparagine transporter-like permease|nr:amino acid permease-associated region [Massilibacillus sp.]
MAFGNIIGSGIFLASSLVITIAGPLTPLAYLLGGLVMMMEVAFIIEMAIANPVPGSFKVCAQEVFGDWWGFVNGWMFWASGVLGMASEVTACAIFARFWLPSIPLWVLSLLFAVAITIINFNDLKGLSKISLGLSLTKILTLILFIFIGILLAIGVPIGHVSQNPIFLPLLNQDPYQSIMGLFGSMLLIFFAYTGTGIIAMAAVETENPEKTVPPAAKIITLTIILLYTLAAFFMVTLLPAELVDSKVSPFVQLFTMFQIPYAGDIINFILLTSALSALNSQVYSASRMLFSLAKHAQAPKVVGYQNRKNIPVTAIAISGTVLLLTAMLSYILPEQIFIYTVSASGFLALVNWLSVSATHYYYRKKLLITSPEKLKYKAPGYPYLSWLCFGSVLIAILSIPLYPDQLPGLYSGCILLFIISACYFIVHAIK